MKNKINYNILFNDMCINVPKSIKGDDYEIKEIKIAKNKLYCPKIAKTMTNINIRNSFKKKNSLIDSNSNNDNADEINTQRPKTNQTFKYCIYTNPNNLIYISESSEYHTNDKDLKNLIDLMNEPPTKEFGYSNVIDEQNCKVYKRMVEGIPVILIKCIAKIPFSKDTIFEAIANLDIRKQWDSVFSELKVVNYEGENGAEILYMIIKSPVLFISDRDFVQQRKMWKNFPTNNSHILHFISVENHDCPPNKKCVRAETIISGYYMQDDPNEPGHSVLGVLSQTDIKGNIPHVLVNKFAPKSSRNWVKSLLKGCKIVVNKNQ
jgi:hypothetical protein